MLRLGLGVLIAAFAFPWCAVAADTSPVLGPGTPGLAAEWWQWAMAGSRATSPVADTTGERCADGQRGEVWFLAGGFGSSKIRRSCRVPAGRTLYFPLINMAYWRAEEDHGFTCEDAKSRAALNNETALDLFAEIDGRSIADLKQYRQASDHCFNLFARVPRRDRPYNAYPSATDGYWLQLKPLSRGQHILKFGGRYNRSSPEFGRMVQDIEYVLTVE